MNRLIQELFEDAPGYINIREIQADAPPKTLFFTLENFSQYQPPQDKNIYFGVYARTRKQGTEKACSTTKCLWLDFDYMELDAVKKALTDAGLPQASVYISSGHGVHTYWILEEHTRNTTELLKHMALLTGADTRATDTARIMRLPGTMNTKGEPIPCKVLEGDYRKYNRALFDALIPIVTEQAPPPIMKEKAPRSILKIPELMNSKRYCITQMANGAGEGHRNFIQGRLIKYLQLQKYTREQTEDIIIKWNRNNEPPIPEGQLLRDFNSYWKNDYKLLGCTMDNAELQSMLQDYCNRQKCNNDMLMQIKLDTSVPYNNRVFTDYHNRKGAELLLLGLLLRHQEGLTLTQIESKLTPRKGTEPCIKFQTIRTRLNTLNSHGLIDIIPTNQRCTGKENLYKIILQGTYGTGYTLVSNGALNGAIDGRVSLAELKLYVLLLKYAYSKGSCYPSQITLAKEYKSRATRTTISKHLKELETNDYIKKDCKVIDGTEVILYRLLV